MVSQVGLNSANYSNISYCGNNDYGSTNVDAGELKNCLLAKDKNLATTENGNTYKTTNTNKVIGGLIGGLAPLVTNIVKNKGLSGLLGSWKTLAISCPAFALAGLALGAIVDSVLNTKKAQKADNEANNQVTPDLANTRLGVDTVA